VLSVDFTATKGTFRLQPHFEAGSELVVVIGASGSGKTLSLQAIAGLLEPTEGRIVLPDGTVAFDGATGTNVAPQQRNVGYVVQELALFPHLTVQQNVEFAISHWTKVARRTRANELLSLLGLEGLGQRKPGAISGGQQQRVALARALAAEPQLLLLDEPFAALDSALRSLLRRELKALRRRFNLTALLVTHDIVEAFSLADRIVAYHSGRVLQSGSRDEVFYRPRSREVAELVDVRNFVPGDVIGIEDGSAIVRTAYFTARVPGAGWSPGATVYVCIRPEHVVVLREGRSAHHPDDPMLDVEIVDDSPGATVHRVLMRVSGDEQSSASPFVFEVDVPARPYEILDVPSRRQWRVALLAERLFLVPR
jgi:ABC-type sulfate/molybdate transport systems ATPase subunit